MVWVVSGTETRSAPEGVFSGRVAGEEPHLGDLAAGDAQEVDTVHAHRRVAAAAAELDGGGDQVTVAHQRVDLVDGKGALAGLHHAAEHLEDGVAALVLGAQKI